MKKILLLLVIILSNCKEKNNEETINKDELIIKKNEVVLIINDTVKSFFSNLRVNELEEKPDLLYLGKEHNKTSVTIPTEKNIKLNGIDPLVSYFYQVIFEKGDSVVINLEKIKISQTNFVEMPFFNIINSKRKYSEINFDNILYKENIKTKAIKIDTINLAIPKWDLKKMYDNAVKLLDKLKEKKEISTEFYVSRRFYQKIEFASSTIYKSKDNNIDYEKLGINLNDNNQLKNDQYIKYLRTVIVSKYFNAKGDIDYSEQFDFVYDNKTFLNKNTKIAVLSSYLKNILQTDKVIFEKYFEKFDKINTNQVLKKEWNEIKSELKSKLTKLNQNNRTSGILTNLVDNNQLNFEEVLTKHKGKIILVDFWASWCSPCREQMAQIEDLKLKFNESEFQIVKISIDKDYSAWVRASKIEKLTNDKNSFIMSDWKNTQIYKNFNIQNIPRYMIFDRKGKIINDDAPNPIDNKLEKIIKASI